MAVAAFDQARCGAPARGSSLHGGERDLSVHTGDTLGAFTGLTSAGISLSILAVAAFSVNMYTLPLDVFGAAPAGFADRRAGPELRAGLRRDCTDCGHGHRSSGYTPVIAAVTFTPLAACAVLWFTRSTR
jgi:hypothetical protein